MLKKSNHDYRKILIGLTVLNQGIRKIVLLVSIFYICLFLFSCTTSRQKLGEDIISKIELYKKTNMSLPKSLLDVGMEQKESGPIYYNKVTDTSYTVHYGLGLGESMVYDSQTKKWNSDHQ